MYTLFLFWAGNSARPDPGPRHIPPQPVHADVEAEMHSFPTSVSPGGSWGSPQILPLTSIYGIAEITFFFVSLFVVSLHVQVHRVSSPQKLIKRFVFLFKTFITWNFLGISETIAWVFTEWGFLLVVYKIVVSKCDIIVSFFAYHRCVYVIFDGLIVTS